MVVMTVTAEWVRAAMMPRPTPEGHDPPDKTSVDLSGQEWVTHHALVAAGATYRQVDYWTRLGLLDVREPCPGSGHRRLFPASEVRIVATMRVLTEAGLEPAAAACAARNDGWIAPGIRITCEHVVMGIYDDAVVTATEP